VGHHRIDQFDLRFLLQKPTGQFKQVVVGSTADSWCRASTSCAGTWEKLPRNWRRWGHAV